MSKHENKENSRSLRSNKSQGKHSDQTQGVVQPFKQSKDENIVNNNVGRIANIIKEEFLKACIGGACLGNSAILSECLAIKNIESKIVDGYSTLGGHYFNRHVWVEVNGKIFDCEPIKDILEEKFDEKTTYYKKAPNTLPGFQGEMLTGDTEEEIETYKKLEEAIEIFKRNKEEGLEIIFNNKKIRKIRKSCLRKVDKIQI